MAEFAEMRTMDIWYARLSEQDLLRRAQRGGQLARRARTRSWRRRLQKNAAKGAQKAHTRDSLQALSKLAELVDGQYRIVSQPPVVVPLRELAASHGYSAEEIEHMIHEQFRAYRATLQDDRRHLLERFEVVDVARKVVGVGSVGTRAFIVLLQGRDQQDPLFLQVKEATGVGAGGPPAQEPLRPARRTSGAGTADDAGRQRHLPRAGRRACEDNRYLYWRQLRDMKGSAVVETMAPADARVLRARLRRHVGAGPRPIG